MATNPVQAPPTVSLPSPMTPLASTQYICGIALPVFADGFAAGVASFDTVAPVIVVVSPTPGATPGTGDAFPSDPIAAQATPIVLRVTDLRPGLALVVVTATFLNDTIVETIYRRGAFRGAYAASSYSVVISNGVELHCIRAGGWPPGSLTNGDIAFDVDAIDAAGNLAA